MAEAPVYLRETHPPKGVARAEWMLVTTESLHTTADVDLVIGY